MITLERLTEYRSHTFGYHPKNRVKTRDEAILYVNERGYIYFWPINGITLPNLWGAVSGDRPVPNEHDDPGHVSWDWKDSLLGKHIWYYGKILRKKATIISMAIAPYFYALTENYGSPEQDYLTIYEQGRMTQEAKAVYEALLENSPLDTITLRKAAHMTSHESESRFNRALIDLQADFKIMPVDVVDAGPWHYSFSYNIVARHEPELLEKARYLGELDARQKILELYFRSVGASQLRDLVKLFGWKPIDLTQAVQRLDQSGVIQNHQKLEGLPGEWMVLNDIC
jgi:tetratricopeptide (TPR) repeat protein